MQNEHGLIKIGRSVDPERRRRVLEAEERCRIVLVAVQENWGRFEEAIHIDMDDFRIMGEWFSGDAFARELALIHFGMPKDTKWPFELNQMAAEAWLDELEQWRTIRSVRKSIDHTIQTLRRAEPGAPFLDFHIWHTIWVVARGKDWWVSVDRKGRDIVTNSSDEAPRQILAYTTDVEAALTLWPDGDRPARWLRSAKDCCIAALKNELEVVQGRYAATR